MDFFDRVQYITEKYLTQRAKVRHIKKEKRKAKNAILDWIEAFLWAVSMVLLLNQYLIQAYRIPSGSMIDTLNIGDHVFVNKLIYGPEVLPGFLKLPSFITPKRNDIIIFENPSYISKGTAFDIAQRVIYMLTISLVDLDKDESGEPRVHFLIKRAAGCEGDHFKIEKGEMKIRFAGEDRWVNEREYNKQLGINHNIIRLVREDQYPAINASGKATAWLDRGLQPSNNLIDIASNTERFADSLAYGRARLETLRKAVPHENRYATLLAKERLGWYIPEGRIFPMGDSRDNSRDGRYFGPVKVSKVLGKGTVIYWPASRIGGIK